MSEGSTNSDFDLVVTKIKKLILILIFLKLFFELLFFYFD